MYLVMMLHGNKCCDGVASIIFNDMLKSNNGQNSKNRKNQHPNVPSP